MKKKFELNPLRVFSPYARNMFTKLRMFSTFWFFHSPITETPKWILTLNTSNDAVLSRDDPYDGYKGEISYLTDFFTKFEKNTIVLMGKFFRLPSPVVHV